MNHEMPNNDNFNSTSILDWFTEYFSDYLPIQMSKLENAHMDTPSFPKNKSDFQNNF